jgi:hypothetical protein
MANVSVTADPADREAWKRAGFSETLINDDLAPAKQRNWRTWSIACMWMSDVHSVGGYVFAAGLFFLGLTGWQVLVALLAGICIVNYFMNRMGLPGHRLGVPYPVFARVSFGVFGANIPALIRAVIGIAWYGIQTWLASVAVVVAGFNGSSQRLREPTVAPRQGPASAGVLQPRVLRGLALSAAATAARSSAPCMLRSVPFGKYCRSRPLVFSFVPRCHGLCGSQK